MGGDFNTTLYKWKKKGGSPISYPFQENMEDLIEQKIKQIDIKPFSYIYTWNNRILGPRHIVI